jgi:Flp pilus assembly secretin CpaC
MRRILRALEAHPGVETLAEPEVVTISGRQTQMRATTINNVLTNYTYAETSSNLSVIPQTGTIQFGPMFDVIPSVSADTQSIYLHATALVTDFVGYDQPTNPTVLIHTKLGKKFNLPNVMPCWCIQKESADITVPDNQTIILGLSGLKKQFYDGGKEVSSKPSFFKQDGKEILFLVTVTLVDDAGNRIHSN